MSTLQDIGRALAEGLNQFSSVTGLAAAQANDVSRQAQSAQASFNQQSANQANSITDNRLLSQYGYNSAMMSAANDYNTNMWQQTADWNEMMWEKQAEFNKKEAEKQRQWQEKMASTQYQRAVQDMSSAGLNPILAVTNGGIGTSIPGGSTASVGGSSMSSAQSAQTSGGVVGAESASINNYTGQLEQLTGMLGLLTALASSSTSAQEAADTLGQSVKEVANQAMSDAELKQTYDDIQKLSEGGGSILDTVSSWLKFTLDNRPGSALQHILSNGSKKK